MSRALSVVMMSVAAMAMALTLATTTAGCSRPANTTFIWMTGTCPGACDYYSLCKERSGDRIDEPVHDACVKECGEIFSSSESIIAFESLICEDAIAFVEGPSGREPGVPMAP